MLLFDDNMSSQFAKIKVVGIGGGENGKNVVAGDGVGHDDTSFCLSVLRVCDARRNDLGRWALVLSSRLAPPPFRCLYSTPAMGHR